ncbi:MAG: glycosyltransferase [Candidatus Omnitrophica bacterium]|nr:glycosyltransferase [Candidatus Omnitrophota bacterium]
MPRAGQNPMRWAKEVHHPSKVNIATAVHIPCLDGYWKEGMDVLKLCLKSLRENTGTEFDLLVFDNASCAEVREFLTGMRDRGEIEFLVLSEHNIGKVGAWNFLFSAAPGEIISYADSDVFFAPGWFEASLKILEAFPEAGMITALPVPGDLSQDEVTLKGVQKDDSISVKEAKDLIPQRYAEAHRKSLGETEAAYGKRIQKRRDVLINRGGVDAYISASHFQFTTTKKILEKLFPLDTKIPLGDDRTGMSEAGFWRLSTTEYLVHHMGNKLPSFKDELNWLKIEDTPSRKGLEKKRSRNRFLDNRFTRPLLKKINAVTYKILYE